ncbi:rhodanese-like domain-containing protein [Halorientalis brevis]|uniref:Rhodanese-like domain-containing protein n=1 Tax=Halorientalis brevis TaxID=1126241 RepID=A0ABD6CD90_9EURY|nr:rhodanese-like domain-containing protein [Halorientalis brevis]
MVDEITGEELQDRLDEDGLRIVDIRSPHGFRHGHIPDSENLPLQQLATQVDRLADADRIVTVCPHGKSSIQAARLINSYEGIDDGTAVSLAGGLEAWDGPVATADGGSDSEPDEGPSAPF